MLNDESCDNTSGDRIYGGLLSCGRQEGHALIVEDVGQVGAKSCPAGDVRIVAGVFRGSADRLAGGSSRRQFALDIEGHGLNVRRGSLPEATDNRSMCTGEQWGA